MKDFKMTPLRLLLIIVVGIILLIAATREWDTSSPSSAARHLYIPSPGFNGDFDGLTIFFNEETIVNDCIKVILDGEVRWIRLEVSP